MKTPTALVVVALLVACAVDARAVTIAWSPVGNPGNAPDLATGSIYGAVGYSYNVGTYDVTVNQYVEFLNAKVSLTAPDLGPTVLFTDSGDSGILIDGFLAPEPEPSSLMLAALGLVGLVVWGWSKRRA